MGPIEDIWCSCLPIIPSSPWKTQLHSLCCFQACRKRQSSLSSIQGALSSQDKKWMGDPSYAGKKLSYWDITWNNQRITVEMMNLDDRTLNRLSLGSCYVDLQDFPDFLIF